MEAIAYFIFKWVCRIIMYGMLVSLVWGFLYVMYIIIRTPIGGFGSLPWLGPSVPLDGSVRKIDVNITINTSPTKTGYTPPAERSLDEIFEGVRVVPKSAEPKRKKERKRPEWLRFLLEETPATLLEKRRRRKRDKMLNS